MNVWCELTTNHTNHTNKWDELTTNHTNKWDELTTKGCRYHGRVQELPPRYLGRITEKTVDEFTDKAARLHKDRFAEKELRMAFFSRHGFEKKLIPYLRKKGVATEF